MSGQNVEVIRGDQLQSALERQMRQQREWRSVPSIGIQTKFHGKDFWILPGTFPPGDDTYRLARNLEPVSNQNILDFGTGTGAIAVYAASRNAAHVHAVDINPLAIKNAQMNAALWNIESKISFQVADGLDQVSYDQKFDIVAANLPGRNLKAEDHVQASHWDSDFKAHNSLFRNAKRLLGCGGRIIVAKANYPELNDLFKLSEEFGFDHEIIDIEVPIENDPRRALIISFTASM